MSEIIIVATGDKWVGYGIRSFSSLTDEMMNSAEKEIVMTMYVFSDMKVVENLLKALERGISVEIFIYHPDSLNRYRAIQEIFTMAKNYKTLRIHIVNEEVLHAKVLIIDSDTVLSGSANPTFGGMVKNYELGFLIKDGIIAQKVLTLLRRLV